jgi:hypothetical protein
MAASKKYRRVTPHWMRCVAANSVDHGAAIVGERQRFPLAANAGHAFARKTKLNQKANAR